MGITLAIFNLLGTVPVKKLASISYPLSILFNQ